MARLKFGNFEVKAELPELVKDGFRETSGIDALKAIVQDVMAGTPQAPETPAKDSGLDQMVNDHAMMLMELHDRVTDLELEPGLELPEIKHITHVKDVSPEVIKFCERMGLRIENKYDVIVAGLDKQRQDQKSLNIVLSFGLILTILLHLL
jgi:hypothetical protein